MLEEEKKIRIVNFFSFFLKKNPPKSPSRHFHIFQKSARNRPKHFSRHFLLFFLVLLVYSMAVGMLFFGEACRQLRHTLPKAVPKTVPAQTTRIAERNRLQSSTRQWTRPSPWQSVKSTQWRPFSMTPQTAHGHITPPKPGEEYA